MSAVVCLRFKSAADGCDMTSDCAVASNTLDLAFLAASFGDRMHDCSVHRATAMLLSNSIRRVSGLAVKQVEVISKDLGRVVVCNRGQAVCAQESACSSANAKAKRSLKNPAADGIGFNACEIDIAARESP